MERSASASFEAAEELQTLKVMIRNRHSLKYLPREAQIAKEKLPTAVQQTIEAEVLTFYETIAEYIELWEQSFDGSEIF
jgi:hypothetical protein